MRPRLFHALTVLAFAILGVGRSAEAQLSWFGGPERDLSLSVVVEDNVRGGCWSDRDATRAAIARTLDAYGIAVTDEATTNLVVYAVGHPSGDRLSRLACVGVLQVRVSSLTVAQDRSVTVTSLYDQERLLVSHDRLDRAISTLALELVDNFSRRYSGSLE